MKSKSTAWTNPHEQAILALGLDVGDGETSQGLECPACRGGHSKKRSFYITRESGALKYICFRATCALAGAVGSRASTASSDRVTKKRSVAKPPIRLEALSRVSRAYIRNKFPLIAEVFEGHLRSYNGRVCVPIRDTHGRRVGWQCRDYTGLQQPKSIVHYEADTHLKHDFTNAMGSTTAVVIVEDQPSSYAVTHLLGIDSLALLGSLVTDDLVVYLRRVANYQRIYVALDWDARGKGLKASRRNKALGLETILLKKDPKDMTMAELEAAFRRVDCLTFD